MTMKFVKQDATLLRRSFAFLFDWVFILLLSSPYLYLFIVFEFLLDFPGKILGNNNMQFAEGLVYMSLWLPCSCTYFMLDGTPQQASWGKMLLGLRLERLDGTQLSKRQAILRYLTFQYWTAVAPYFLYGLTLLIININSSVSSDGDMRLFLSQLLCLAIYYYSYRKATPHAFFHDRKFTTRVVRIHKMQNSD